MKRTRLGKTGVDVSILGAGLAEIGNELSLDQADLRQASQVLNGALDSGLTFLDTAECYGVSEELIGLTVSKRRSEYFLATKAGHSAGLGQEWTYETLSRSIDRSLQRTKTDRLDLVQLHSCGVSLLEQGDVIRVLQDARKAGKVRFIGYSGDNEAAHWAVGSGHFDTLQTSFNIVDQQALTTGLLKKAEASQMGIIVKRPIAGATWGKAKAALSGKSAGRVRGYDSGYFDRCKAMASEGPLPGEPADHVALAMGFLFSHAEVDVAIVGTKDPRHMEGNLALVQVGPSVDRRAIDELHARFESLGAGWQQLN